MALEPPGAHYPWFRGRPPASVSRSRRVRRVLVYVGGRQVGGADGGRVRPGTQVDRDGHVPGAQVGLGPVIRATAVAADPHPIPPPPQPPRLATPVRPAP